MQKKKLSNKSAPNELARAAMEFERADYKPRFAKAPAGEQRRHDAALRMAKRGPGRPVVGAGARRVQITVERNLLAKADRFAHHQRITRSELVARGLRLALAS